MASNPIPTISIILTLILIPTITNSLPFVVFHGLLERCSDKRITQLTELLSNLSSSQGYCIEIGVAPWDSSLMPFLEQTEIACEKVKNMSELSEGYNIVGLSQGNLVGRGVLEFCDGAPPVKNFVSLGGPHAGIASFPYCSGSFILQCGLLCAFVDGVMAGAIYSDFVQEHVAPSNYIKIPTDIIDYELGCKFLPKLNNEFNKNSTYKERFASLQKLVLIMFDKDTVLVPKETSWFGYYPEGSWSTILPAQKTKLYIEDWIGLKTLDKAGKVKFINVSGGHLGISYNDTEQFIVPYLVDEASKKPAITDSSHTTASAASGFIKKLAGLARKEQRLQRDIF